MMVNKPRILVIDDEEVIRVLSEKILTSYGFEVVAAERGEEGIDAYKLALSSPKPFSAVILDLTLGEEMSGRETLRRLKEIDPDVRAIVCSGHSSEPVMADWARHGFAGALLKPFRAEDLVNTVRKAIGSQD